MAEFLPFKGLRYNQQKVDLANVLAPPYDVIKGPMRQQLISRSPFNVVEVELPEGDGDAKYEAASAFLSRWIADGVLQLDDRSFYLYEQEFAVPGSAAVKKRRGLLGALTLEEFGKGVQPHEHTLSGPKEDRLKLLRATRTNTSPIFGLFADSDDQVQSVVEAVAATAPAVVTSDGDGIIHRLWQITEDDSIKAVVEGLKNEPVLIADGHHRYETALNYRNERRLATIEGGGQWTGAETENAVMMMCVAISDQGLVVLPTHRLIHCGAEAAAELPDRLAEQFRVQPLSDQATAAQCLEALNDDQPGLFVLHTRSKNYILSLLPGDAHLAAMDTDRGRAYNRLDVSLLHKLILENLLDIDAAKLAGGGYVGYTIDAAEAMAKVESGEYEAAFLLRPTPVDQVREVASDGDKMPQKSTYFYPKLITGIVLRPL